jgi:hypothetical protein
MCRDVYEGEVYIPKDARTELPMKWMAPDSFEAYTFAGDVVCARCVHKREHILQWAYGVCVWELMTRGATPYPTVNTWQLLEYLHAGNRLPCPPMCPQPIYDYLMMPCWEIVPEYRPTFIQICTQLPQLIYRLERGDSGDGSGGVRSGHNS